MADRKYRWQDFSVRDPGERLQEPNELRIFGDAMNITLRHRTFMSGDSDWWIVCSSLELHGPLKATTAREAQIEAIEMVQTKLERMMADLHLMKGAPHVG
jgi:hypothetical protein